MQFGYTIMYVQDVEATILFYEKAFSQTCLFLHESKQYGELATGNTKLAFVSEGIAQSNEVEFIPNVPSNKAAGIEIAFVTDDVEQAYQQALTAGAIKIKAPMQKPWGQLVAYVRDINGMIVEICSPMT